MLTNRFRRFGLMTAFLGGGVLFQLGGCGGVGGLINFAQNLNPCGSILACDPVQFRFLTSGYEGPGVDPDIDPACTFPPFCAGDPFVMQQQP